MTASIDASISRPSLLAVMRLVRSAFKPPAEFTHLAENLAGVDIVVGPHQAEIDALENVVAPHKRRDIIGAGKSDDFERWRRMRFEQGLLGDLLPLGLQRIIQLIDIFLVAAAEELLGCGLEGVEIGSVRRLGGNRSAGDCSGATRRTRRAQSASAVHP